MGRCGVPIWLGVDKARRQGTFLEALQTLPGLSIFYGKYQQNPFTCLNRGFVHQIPNDKMTDVNIAVELMQDAFRDLFDTPLVTTHVDRIQESEFRIACE